MAKTERQGGRYRKMLLEQQGQAPQEEEPSAGWVFFRIRFYTCICLFVAYVILDYTKASVVSVDSSRIYAEIERDLAEDFDLEEAWSKAVESVRISGAEDEENERETEEPETDKPEMEEPETDQPGTDEPETDQLETDEELPVT